MLKLFSILLFLYTLINVGKPLEDTNNMNLNKRKPCTRRLLAGVSNPANQWTPYVSTKITKPLIYSEDTKTGADVVVTSDLQSSNQYKNKELLRNSEPETFEKSKGQSISGQSNGMPIEAPRSQILDTKHNAKSELRPSAYLNNAPTFLNVVNSDEDSDENEIICDELDDSSASSDENQSEGNSKLLKCISIQAGKNTRRRNPDSKVIPAVIENESTENNDGEINYRYARPKSTNNYVQAKFGQFENTRICYACTSANNPTCWSPNKQTTIKYCRQGYSCISKTLTDGDTLTMVRDCGKTCENNGISALIPQHQSCSICHNDLCNAAEAINTNNLIVTLFILMVSKYICS